MTADATADVAKRQCHPGNMALLRTSIPRDLELLPFTKHPRSCDTGRRMMR
jgi:hypothetical protein